MMMEKHDFISAQKSKFSVTMLCDLLDVSKSWFYGRSQTEGFRQEKQQRQLTMLEHIRRVFKKSRSCYKTPLEAFNEMTAQAA